MRIGTEPIRENEGNLRPRRDYYTFYTKLVGNLKERKYPWYRTLCPFHEDRKNPNLDINIVSGRFKCYACFTEGNGVITKTGIVNIKNVSENDFVLTQDNRYSRVLRTFKRSYTGNLYYINIGGIRIDGVTPTHKMQTIRIRKCRYRKDAKKLCIHSCNKCAKKNDRNYEIKETRVENLTLCDFIEYTERPIVKHSFIAIDKYRIKKDTGRLNSLPKTILFNNDFIKFIALYVAEGSFSGRNVMFTFHIKEKVHTRFLEKYIQKTLGMSCAVVIVKEQNKRTVVCSSVHLGQFLSDLCGIGAKNKKIPEQFLQFDKTRSRFLFDRLIEGDGHIDRKGRRRYTTISKLLAQQIFELCIRAEYAPAVSIEKKKLGHKKVYRISTQIKRTYESRNILVYEGKKFIRVLQIDRKYVRKVPVYNMEIQNTHKYNILGLVVHNCGAKGGPWDFIVLKKPDGKYVFNFPDSVTDPAEIRKILQFEAQEEKEVSELTLRVEERRAEQAHEFLFRQPLALQELHRDRGLTDDTIKRWKIGFMKGVFTFPIYDIMGDMSSLKFHKRFQTEGAVNQLYPWTAVLRNPCPYVLLVEGEFDMLITHQHGFNSVTQTAGANSWNDRFTRYFRGKTVYIAYDNDEPGRKNAAIIANKMWDERINALIVAWPAFMKEKEDNIDFFVKYGKTTNDYRALLKTARGVAQ